MAAFRVLSAVRVLLAPLPGRPPGLVKIHGSRAGQNPSAGLVKILGSPGSPGGELQGWCAARAVDAAHVDGGGGDGGARYSPGMRTET